MKPKLTKQQKVAAAFERDLRNVIDQHRGSGVLRVAVVGIMDMMIHELLHELEVAK